MYLRGNLHQQHYSWTDDIKVTALILISAMSCSGLSMSAGQLYIEKSSWNTWQETKTPHLQKCFLNWSGLLFLASPKNMILFDTTLKWMMFVVFVSVEFWGRWSGHEAVPFYSCTWFKGGGPYVLGALFTLLMFWWYSFSWYQICGASKGPPGMAVYIVFLPKWPLRRVFSSTFLHPRNWKPIRVPICLTPGSPR